MKIEDDKTIHQKTANKKNLKKNETSKPSIFSKACEKIFSDFTVEKNDAIKSTKKEHIESVSKTKATIDKEKISNMITKELKKREIKKDKVDIKYWTDKIYNNATKYHIPAEVIVSIISRETRFEKNVQSSNGNGAMQITTAAINGFLESADGNWADLYKAIDIKLYNDIKNHMTKIKGKTYTAKDIRTECGKSDDFCIKVGILLYKLLYLQQVDKLKNNGKSNYATLKETIEKIKKGTITISSKENEKCLHDAFMNYNGSSLKVTYAKDVADSLKAQQKFNFKRQIIQQVKIKA